MIDTQSELWHQENCILFYKFHLRLELNCQKCQVTIFFLLSLETFLPRCEATKTCHILNSLGREGQERVKCFDDTNVGWRVIITASWWCYCYSPSCHRSHLSVTHHTLEARPGVSDIIILHTHVSLWRIELDCKLINRNRDARELRVKPAQVSYLSSKGAMAVWTSWPVKFRDYSWHVTFVTLVVTKSVTSPVTPNTGHSRKCHKLWLNLLSSRETGERISSWNINRNQICLLNWNYFHICKNIHQ